MMLLLHLPENQPDKLSELIQLNQSRQKSCKELWVPTFRYYYYYYFFIIKENSI